MAEASQQAPLGPVFGRYIRPLVSLRARPMVVLAASGLLSMLGVLAALLSTPSYSVSAVLHIAPHFGRNLEEDQELALNSTTQYKLFVHQQTRTVNRYDIVLEALERLEGKVGWRGEEETERHAAERLQGALEIKSVRDTYLATVGLTHGEPEGLADLVNTVVEVYIEKMRVEDLWADDERVVNLESRRLELLDEIAGVVGARRSLVGELGMTNFLAQGSPFDSLLLQAQLARDQAVRNRVAAQARLAAVSPETVEGAAALAALVDGELSDEAALQSLGASLAEKRARILSEITGLSPKHPGRKAALLELEDLDDALVAARRDLAEIVRRVVLEGRRAELAETQQVEESLSEMVAERQAGAARYASRADRGAALTSELARLQDQLERVEDRIDSLRLEATAPGFVRLVTPARPPIIYPRNLPKKIVVFAVALALLGAALGALAAVSLDLLTPALQDPYELEALLGTPNLATVIERHDEASTDFASDEIARLAHRILGDARNHGTKILAVTSPTAGSGVTTLVLDLAAELAGMDANVLAVEADASNPDERFGEGTGTVMALTGDWRASVVPSLDHGADRMPIGALEGKRLPCVSRAAALFSSLRESYDLVLVDCPSILLSADAELLSEPADGVLLVVASGTADKGQVRRAAKEIERLDPGVFGAVFNRTPVYKNGGYYSALIAENAGLETGGVLLRLAHVISRLQGYTVRIWARLRGSR